MYGFDNARNNFFLPERDQYANAFPDLLVIGIRNTVGVRQRKRERQHDIRKKRGAFRDGVGRFVIDRELCDDI